MNLLQDSNKTQGRNVHIKYFFMMFFFSVLLLAVDLQPLKEIEGLDAEKVELGKKLFHDPILSKDHKISCATCHNLMHNGADITKVTAGSEGLSGHFNVPTVYNAVYNFRQFWDGRSKNLKDQALAPISNPVEMGNTLSVAIEDLQKSRDYPRLFNAIYKDGITENNLAEVIAEFEKTLTTLNSPFDNYLRGDESALDPDCLEGYRLFKQKGCIFCHNGVNIGGNLYNKFGIYKDANSKELGRYNITHKEEDMYVFKVPSLRNVALTAPYMHDGRAETLKDAVLIMSQYQLGRSMKEKELQAIVCFLKSLTGELPQIFRDINVKDN